MKSNFQSRNLINRFLDCPFLDGPVTVITAVITSAFLLSSGAKAVDLTWTGGSTDGSWGAAANWGGTAFTNGVDVIFDGSANPVTFISSARTVNSITFKATAGAAFDVKTQSAIAGAVSRTLTFSNVNTGITIEDSASSHSISGITGGSGSFINLAGPLTVTNNDGDNPFIITRPIFGSFGVTKAGVGTLVYSGPVGYGSNNLYAGDTTIQAGTFRIGASNVIPDGTGKGNVIVDGTFDLNSNNETINGLSGSGIIDTTTGDAILTVGANDQGGTFSGVIQDTSGPLALTKIGSATLTLSNVNTYDGATTISNGKLVGVVGGSSATSAASLTSAAATLGVSVPDNTKQWSYASVSTDAAGTIEFNFGGTAPSASLAPLAIVGAAAFNTTPVISVVGSNLSLGSFPLMSWATTTGTAPTGSGPGVLSLPSGVLGNLSVVGETLFLTITSIELSIVKADNTTDLNLAASWVGGVVPGATDLAKWDSTVTSANTTVLGADQTWKGITIANPADLVTIDSGFTLTLGAASVDIDMSSATQNLTLNCGLSAGAPNAWSIGADRTLTLGGVVSGASSISKTGLGTTTLSGANTFNGGLELSAGVLNLNSATALGDVASTFAINGGSIDTTNSPVVISNNNPQAWNADFTFAGTTTGDLDLGTGAVTPSGNRTVTVNAGNLTVGGMIGGGAVSLTKAGLGRLTLAGANTFSGGVIVNGGTLAINNAAALGDAAGILDLNTGALIDNTSGAPITVTNNNPQTWDGNFTFTGSNALNLGTGPVTISANRTVTLTASELAVDGIISGAGYLEKAGEGILTLTGANNFTGDVRMSGVLKATHIADSGVACSLGAGSVIQLGTTVFPRNGTLEYTGSAAASTNRTVSIGVNANGSANAAIVNNNADPAHTLTFTNPAFNIGNTAVISGTRQLTLGGSNTGNNEIQGLIQDHTGSPTPQVSILKNGIGTWLLSGASSFSGGVTANAGTLKFGASEVIPDGAGKGNLTVNALLDMNGKDETVNGLSGNGNGVIDNTAATPCVLTAGNNDQSSTFAGNIVNTAGAISLVKTGAGSLNLTGANTNTGETFVKGGTLVVNGTSITDTARLQIKESILELAADETVDTLYIDGVPMAAGTYGSSSVALPPVGIVVDDVHFSATGTGILTVNNIGPVLGTPFEDWISDFYPNEPEASDPNFVGPDADPDMDGQSNIVEFALGGAPNSGSNNAKVYSLIADGSVDGDTTPELLMTVAVRSGTPAFTGNPSPSATHEGFIYNAQGSTTLASFTTGVTLVDSVSAGLPAVPAGYEYRTFSLDGSNGPTGKGFLRMTISEEP